jgi:hypothetical protein
MDFEDMRAMSVKITVFCEVTSCILVDGNKAFVEIASYIFRK